MKSLLLAEVTDCYIIDHGCACPYFLLLKKDKYGAEPLKGNAKKKRREADHWLMCTLDDHKVPAYRTETGHLYKNCPLPRITAEDT